MQKFSRHTFSAQSIFAWIFSILFLAICAAILISTITTFIQSVISTTVLYNENEIPDVVINAISNLIIALAMFELYLVINVDTHPESNYATIHALLDSAPRFIIVVCVALALEGLVLVIKLSQDENNGDLLLPIAVIGSAAFLLLSLGLFLKLCPRKLPPAQSDPEVAGERE